MRAAPPARTAFFSCTFAGNGLYWATEYNGNGCGIYAETKMGPACAGGTDRGDGRGHLPAGPPGQRRRGGRLLPRGTRRGRADHSGQRRGAAGKALHRAEGRPALPHPAGRAGGGAGRSRHHDPERQGAEGPGDLPRGRLRPDRVEHPGQRPAGQARGAPEKNVLRHAPVRPARRGRHGGDHCREGSLWPGQNRDPRRPRLHRGRGQSQGRRRHHRQGPGRPGLPDEFSPHLRRGQRPLFQ